MLEVGYSSFVIRHSSFVIRHSSFVIRHSSFVIRHQQSIQNGWIKKQQNLKRLEFAMYTANPSPFSYYK
ncbi:hypothetical protein L2089_21135 [Paenibacillus hunanensis]|uniref:hypothetical protein n=1 Tax=Paenibacillus hunanensis TaxID=539262 RepID=UPI0020272E37|nr:hypothetical protein [Paenibacillus hunanensis]MCL9663193.1 hypothetical protein [Paenibacillus hunanensis]